MIGTQSIEGHNMAEQAVDRQTGLLIENGFEEDVGIHKALHEEIGFAQANQLDSLGAGFDHIIGLDQLGVPEGDALLLHYTLDSGDITDENGADHTGLLGSGHGLDGIHILRGGTGQHHRLALLCFFQHLFKRNDH